MNDVRAWNELRLHILNQEAIGAEVSAVSVIELMDEMEESWDE